MYKYTLLHISYITFNIHFYNVHICMNSTMININNINLYLTKINDINIYIYIYNLVISLYI